MNQIKVIDFLDQNISTLKGVGKKTKILLKKKNIEKISDLLWQLPQGFIDRSDMRSLDNIEIGKITTIKVKVVKHNFPRIRNLPNKVTCEDDKGKIDIVFFNSREGYIRNVLPVNSVVIISGKVNFFREKYQITNPAYIVPISKKKYVNKIIPKYSLTEGLTEKVYRRLIDQVLEKIKDLDEWHSNKILKMIGNISWSKSIFAIHNRKKNDLNSNFHRRLAYDEILANFLVLSQVRKRIRKLKKNNKKFGDKTYKKIIENFGFTLTKDQQKTINEIDNDLKSNLKMFRLLQGDVGSGKTIVSLIAAANTIKSNYQVVLMAPTEILAKQHFNLAKKIFKSININISFLSGKSVPSDKKIIIENLLNGKIDFLIGTHALFQKKIEFKRLV